MMKAKVLNAGINLLRAGEEFLKQLQLTEDLMDTITNEDEEILESDNDYIELSKKVDDLIGKIVDKI